MKKVQGDKLGLFTSSSLVHRSKIFLHHSIVPIFQLSGGYEILLILLGCLMEQF
jgi:hypothetical protein